MTLLAVNCGSSSLKGRVFSADAEQVLAEGRVERIGESEGRLVSRVSGDEHSRSVGRIDHGAALALLSEAFFAAVKDGGVGAPPDVVGHRVVHGGEAFREAVIIDDSVEAAIDALTPLAPMHNPLCLQGIRRARKLFPDARHVAVFDTAFHSTLPPRAYLYPLPYALYENDGVRRYGFHGTSHRFAAERAARLRGNQPARRVITCHLGAGCSLAAVRDGRSVDTSMGMTPLEGVMMATRSGDIDPGLFAYLTQQRGMPPRELDRMLNHESGLLGVSGRSGDIRELEKAAAAGDDRAELALELFAYRVRKSVGSYLAVLGGIDALVFTGGAGSNSASLRARVLAGLDDLGIVLDAARNQACGGREALISPDAARASVFVVPANEELLIAREALGAIR